MPIHKGKYTTPTLVVIFCVTVALWIASYLTILSLPTPWFRLGVGFRRFSVEVQVHKYPTPPTPGEHRPPAFGRWSMATYIKLPDSESVESYFVTKWHNAYIDTKGVWYFYGPSEFLPLVTSPPLVLIGISRSCRALLAKHRHSNNCCVTCGYPSGNDASVCPECGNLSNDAQK